MAPTLLSVLQESAMVMVDPAKERFLAPRLYSFCAEIRVNVNKVIKIDTNRNIVCKIQLQYVKFKFVVKIVFL